MGAGVQNGVQSEENPGVLSHPQPREHWVSAPQAPPKVGWGPGGRRFKSCLPDSRKPRSSGVFVTLDTNFGYQFERVRRDHRRRIAALPGDMIGTRELWL